MAALPPQPTLAALLDRPELHLQLLSDTDASRDALHQPIRWVHSSDLADPTPFLAEDLILLTTGTQFEQESLDATVYVERLLSRGIIALGFGTEVVREGVPAALEDACKSLGLTLFLVPYSTPFIAIARANAEAIAAQSYARRSWALAAQRAIALAALRPDGLGATLAELAKQLDTWVGMYDPTGSLVRQYPDPLAPSVQEALDTEAQSLLGKKARAASSLSIEQQPFTVHTLGRGGHLRGALAIRTSGPDQEGRSVITSVIAMAGLALEQHHTLDRARATLRAGSLRALLGGHTEFAAALSESLQMSIPTAPLLVNVLDAPTNEGVAEWLALQSAEHPGALFFGESEEHLVILANAQYAHVARTAAHRFHLAVAQAEAASTDQLTPALSRARLALRSATPGHVSTFSPANHGGMLSTLGPESRAVAEAILRPLTEHDAREHTDLLHTLATFLRADASAEQTAQSLGIHRHTVRNRLQAASQLLGRPLESFAVRAELWAAIRALDM